MSLPRNARLFAMSEEEPSETGAGEVTQMLVAASISRRGAVSAEIWEEELDLPRSRLGRVGAVHEVLGHHGGEIAADRSGCALDRVGHAHQRAHRLDRSVTLRNQGDKRTAGDEVDEVTEERLGAVLPVVLFGDSAVERALLQRDDLEALALEP